MSFGGVSSRCAGHLRWPLPHGGRFDGSSASATPSPRFGAVHEFKAGIHLEHALYNQYHQAGGNGFPGSFSFGTDTSNPLDSGYAYANAILGNYDTYSEATNRVDYAPITRIVEWFVQDHWRITSRLTMDVGVRFTDALPQVPNNNNAGNFVPSTFDRLAGPGAVPPGGGKRREGHDQPDDRRGGASGVLGTHRAGLRQSHSTACSLPRTPGFPRAMVYGKGILPAPRFGMAWDPFGDGKMAVRLAAESSIIRAPTPARWAISSSIRRRSTIRPQYYGTVATAANGTGLLSPSSFSRTIDPHAKTVTAYHANFGDPAEHRLGHGGGCRLCRQLRTPSRRGRAATNTVPYGAEFLPQNQNPQTNTPLNDNYFRPYPGYAEFPQQIFEGNSSYHSLQVTATGASRTGVQFGVTYTHSKAMDYAEGDSTARRDSVREFERGRHVSEPQRSGITG